MKIARMKMKEKVKRLVRGIFFVLVFSLIVLPAVSALSMPLAVHGQVYDIATGEPVSERVFVSVLDQNSGFYREGMSGTYFSPGKFAFSVDGEVGDNVIITARHGQHEASVALTLTGSMHGIAIYLNMSDNENSPPTITSTPIERGIVGRHYTYDVEAVDPDGDTLNYTLDISPSGMQIDPFTGLIEWTPSVRQVGSNPVSVRVTDSFGNSDTQDFVVNVSLPRVFVGSNYTVNSSVQHELVAIRVFPSGQNLSVGGRSWSLRQVTVALKDASEVEMLVGEASKLMGEIGINGKLYKRWRFVPLSLPPEQINSIELLVRVRKEWLQTNNISVDEMKVLKYSNNSWIEQKIAFAFDDPNYAYFVIGLDGTGTFAFAGVPSRIGGRSASFVSRSYNLPPFIVGKIYESDGIEKFSQQSKVTIENLDTGERVEFAINTPASPTGEFASFIPAKEGEKVDVYIDGKIVGEAIDVKRGKNVVRLRKKFFGSGFAFSRENENQPLSTTFDERAARLISRLKRIFSFFR
ncbi:hypothetical protein D6817_03915 [Candidatus Pacearchaeota archaeon]|nr:MAG: hypothetical protein D6817_03915 [Candidatus Pacearchaeota archaeon]